MKDNVTGLLNDFIDYEYTKGHRKNSVEKKRQHISRFLDFIDNDTRRMTEDDIVIYLYSIKLDGVSVERINLVVSHLEQFCDYLIDRNVILFNPAKWIEKHRITHGPCVEIDAMHLIKEFIEGERLKGYTKKTALVKERILVKFAVFVGKPLGSITGEDINRFLKITSLDNSYNRRLGYISQFFEFLLELDKVLLNPAVNIPSVRGTERTHSGIFETSEIKSIMESTSWTPTGKRDQTIIEIFYSTGMRISELVNLNLNDIDFRNFEIFIEQGKGNKERIVPVGAEALKTVKVYLQVREKLAKNVQTAEALFLSNRGHRITASSVRKMIHRRKKDAGVLTSGAAHTLRHSCATHLLKNGAPLQAVQRLLGHEVLRATEMYTHISESDLVEKFNEGRRKKDA